MSVRRPARTSGAVEDPKVNRLAGVLRVGMRLRRPAVDAPTGVGRKRDGDVVFTKDERDYEDGPVSKSLKEAKAKELSDLVDEPNEGFVTVTEAFAEFKKAWQALRHPRDMSAMTDPEVDALFPRVQTPSEIPTLGQAMKGPIKVGVYRFNRTPITEPQLKAMPSCVDVLHRVDNFYFHEPDALITGGNEFSMWFRQTHPFESWFVDQRGERGYRYTNQALTFDAGSMSWKMPCTFVTHTPGDTNPDCSLENVSYNWTRAYMWLKAADAANAVLNAGSAVPRTLLKEGGPQDKPHGVIGYDTILPVPGWAKTLLPNVKSWSSANFPSLQVDNKLRFSRGRQTCVTAECVLKLCIQALPELFGKVAETEFTPNRTSAFDDFLLDQRKELALAVWGNHARILYKDNVDRIITVYDPWKQQLVIDSQKWLTSAVYRTGYKIVFQVRAMDQGAEGSCQLQATMRVLMAAVHGKDSIMAKINTEENRDLLIFPVITQLLYTECRSRHRP